MPLFQALLNAVEEANLALAERKHRNHLGGSRIGKECDRALWYEFRWARMSTFAARMVRLFERGHKEEDRFVSYLRDAGVEVREFAQRLIFIKHFEGGDPYVVRDWDEPLVKEGPFFELDVTNSPEHRRIAEEQGIKLKQWRVNAVDTHFSGSLDGKARNFPELKERFGDAWGLVEFKTHNTKSFVHLTQNGVKIAKPEHWAQMQTYMHLDGLRYAVYCAVNKNDDELWFEVVEYDKAAAEKLLTKAERIIWSRKMPDRINNSPSWHGCKFCDFAKQCHYGEPMEKSCRSCEHVMPAKDGQWYCDLWKNMIPGDFIPKGCDSYRSITD